jgi:DNA-binding transcriptional MerR regulator
MNIGFTPGQVTRLTGLPYSTLNLWAKKGLVAPSISTGVGSGNERIYSFRDLITLKVAFELRKAGINTRSLKKVVDFLRENEGLENPLAEARLVVSGRDVILVKNKQQLISVLSEPGQSCLSFIVDLPRTLGEMTEVMSTAIGLAVVEHSPVKGTRKSSVSAKSTRQSTRMHG